jgi:uncharacterized protein YndB with AHSA1/START domain
MATGLRRDVHLPVGTEAVWTAITDPDRLADWFGATVEWDLRPGGRAVWREQDGEREGRVGEVEPGRRLSFTWWPTGDRSEASEVAYELVADEDGTQLTVTERRVPAGEQPATTTASIAATGASTWGPADDAAFGVWAEARSYAVAYA